MSRTSTQEEVVPYRGSEDKQFKLHDERIDYV
jgi:hypothetical protein